MPPIVDQLPLGTGLCQNGYMSMKSEVRHFHSGSLEGRKAQQFRPLCSAALTIPTPYEIVAYVNSGWQAKATAGWPGGLIPI
jgi:hypothetical protein